MLGFFFRRSSPISKKYFSRVTTQCKTVPYGRSLNARPLTQVLVLISPISKFSCVRSARNHGLCIIVHISSSSEVI